MKNNEGIKLLCFLLLFCSGIPLAWSQINFELTDEKALAFQQEINQCFTTKDSQCYLDKMESFSYHLMGLRDFSNTVTLYEIGLEASERLENWERYNFFLSGLAVLHFTLENYEASTPYFRQIITHPAMDKKQKAVAHYRILGNMVTALDKEKAYEIFEKGRNFFANSTDSVDLGNFYAAAGRMETEFGNQILGNEYFFRSVDYRNSPATKHLLCQNYHKISKNFAELKNWEKCKEYIDLAFEIAKKKVDKRPILYHQTLEVYSAFYGQDPKTYDLAKKYAREALEFFKAGKKPHMQLLCYNRLALIASREGNPDLAISYLDSTALFAKTTSNDFILAMAYAEVYLKKRDFAKSQKFLNQSELIINDLPFQSKKRLDYLDLKIDFHTQKGELSKALQLKDEFEVFQDSLNTNQLNQVVHTLEAKYKKAEQDKKIATLTKDKVISQAELKKRNIILIIGGISLSVLALLLAFVYKLFRQNKKNKEALSVNNIKLEKALGEKDYLLKEIHHRVKNNLQVISSLLSLQTRFIKDEVALDAIKSGKTRVQSMSLLHQNLYQDDNIQGVDMPEYFANLTDNLLTTYSNKEKPVSINQEIAPVKLDIDSVVPLGLVANELLTNALKHAFTEQDTGQLQLKLFDKGNQLELMVQDDGKGLPNCELPDTKNSLGTRLIKSFALKMKADIEITCDNGTRIILVINKFKRA